MKASKNAWSSGCFAAGCSSLVPATASLKTDVWVLATCSESCVRGWHPAAMCTLPMTGSLWGPRWSGFWVAS